MTRKLTKKAGATQNENSGAALTAKQDEVRRLIANGQSVETIAELMDTTPRVVRAQITRIRGLGISVEEPVVAAERPSAALAAKNGNTAADAPTVEGVLDAELLSLGDRLDQVERLLESARVEGDVVRERKERLEKARDVLHLA